MELVLSEPELYREFGFFGDCYRGVQKYSEEEMEYLGLVRCKAGMDTSLEDLLEYHTDENHYKRFLSFSESVKIAVDFAIIPNVTFEEDDGVCELICCRNVKGLNFSKLLKSLYDDGCPAIVELLSKNDSPLYEQAIFVDLLSLKEEEVKIIKIDTVLSNKNISQEIASLEQQIEQLNNQDLGAGTTKAIVTGAAKGAVEEVSRGLRGPMKEEQQEINQQDWLRESSNETHLFEQATSGH